MAKKPSKSHNSTASKPTSRPAEKPAGLPPIVWAVVGVLAVAVVYGGYQFLSASKAQSVAAPATSQSAPAASQGTAGESAPITGPEVDGTAQVSNGVQKLAVNVSNVYSPNVIYLKAGVPAELTFSGGQGCTVKVQSQSLGFAADMSAAPATVKLQALQPGTYPFACGMNMVHGRVVVQ
jgi:plastocyanin